MSLQELASKTDVLRPFGETETLLYYGLVAAKLKKFLKGKELAAKNLIPNPRMPYLIKRGSKKKPLYIDDFIAAVTPEFLELRKGNALKDVSNRLDDNQRLVWEYFLPRKLADFFYATNNEGAGREIERIFFDLDRGQNVTKEQARIATKAFVEAIGEEKELALPEPHVFWTGSSFHVFLFLEKERSASFYEKYFQYGKNSPESSLTGRLAKAVRERVGFNVFGGHEKIPNTISIDPSQTPSGKLCRAPFSLHMADAKTADGVDIPIEKKTLDDANLIKKLESYTPRKVIDNLDELSKRLPKKFA